MRAKIISAIYVILMLLSSFFMGASSVNIHNAGIGAGSLNQAELPILYTGNFWKYNMDFDFIAREGGYNVTVDGGINNAKLWFKVTDTFNAKEYEPKLAVDSSSINVPRTRQGETVKKTFNVKNDAKSHPWREHLIWVITSYPDFVTVSPESGILGGKESETVTMDFDTSEMGTFEVYIVVQSTDGSQQKNSSFGYYCSTS